jgi:transcriptional regulator with XRE-family HTH domain
MADPDLLAARRRLAAELRRLRLNAGLSTHQVAAAIGVSQSKVSKIENGHRGASIPDVRAWAKAVGVTSDRVEELVDLAERSLTDLIARRAILRGGAPAHQRRFGELERVAGLIREFEPVFIPGLLQTANYAKQVMTSVRPDRDDVGAAVAARLERQAILYDETKRFEFLLAEGVLRWRLGAIGPHLAQLDRLVAVSTLPNVDLAILPQTTVVPAWHGHGFVIFSRIHLADDDATDADDDGDTLVYVETLTQELRVGDPDDVALYLEVFERLRSQATSGEDSRRLLASVMADLRQLDI